MESNPYPVGQPDFYFPAASNRANRRKEVGGGHADSFQTFRNHHERFPYRMFL
jgi:hypothetical protein